MNVTVFEAINITKKYRNTLALNQVSMSVMQTVARSSLAYTAFFWIIGILFATIFFTKEYNTVQSNYLLHTALNELFSTTPKRLQYWWCL